MTFKELIIPSLYNLALIGICAYLTTQLGAFRRTLNHQMYRARDKLFLIVIFGLFSAGGNAIGMPIGGSLANNRIVGPIVGGLLGGPLVGVGAGILGAIPRYFMGGFTMWPAVIANVIIGFVSGLVFKKYGPRNVGLKTAFLTALASESILKAMVLAFSTSFTAAVELEKVIAGPTIIGNSLAVVIFVYIVRDVFGEQEKVQARAAQRAMHVIRQAENLLRNGLTEVAASRLVDIIFQELQPAAVSVTNATHVLAFRGRGSDHHIKGMPIITAATKKSKQKGKPIILNSKASIGCPHPGCPLTAVVDVPFIVDNEFIGSIKIYKAENQALLPYEAELILGIGEFLAAQLAYYKVEQQKRLLAQAEYNILKAQINPHFLFNTLATIRILIRTDADKARMLIKDLSQLLRRTLNREKEFVSLQEELDTVQHYVRLEQARFGDRVRYIEELPGDFFNYCIPVFSLQPLVENAIKHGLSPKKEGGTVKIAVRDGGSMLYIRVADDGVGIPEEKLAAIESGKRQSESEHGAGIGIVNVGQRLEQIYGDRGGLSISSQSGEGTVVTIRLPLMREFCRDDEVN